MPAKTKFSHYEPILVTLAKDPATLDLVKIALAKIRE
jgi:hypothetical protein